MLIHMFLASLSVDLKHIKYFDLNKIGNIQLLLDNDTVESVSKRRVPIIMKFLKERGDKV